MNHLDYTTCGTCSRLISIDVDADGIIRNLSFVGGCNGNLKGICALAIGKKASDIKQTLKGISCNGKPTSCPDQLATALQMAVSLSHHQLMESGAEQDRYVIYNYCI